MIRRLVITMACLLFGEALLAAENIVSVSHRIDTVHKGIALIEAAKSSRDAADIAKARVFFESLDPEIRCGFFCELYKISGKKSDASQAFQAVQVCDGARQRALLLTAIWEATNNVRCLELARENAAQLENLSAPPKGTTSFAPCQRSHTFLDMYRTTKDPVDLVKARENAPDFFFFDLYRVTKDPADLARINGNVGEGKPTYKNIWWLMELYKTDRDPQYLAKAREFARKHGPNNMDYALPFLEIYKVTKDPQDLAAARESRGNSQFLIRIYEVSKDYADLAAAREVAAKSPNRDEAIWNFTIIWLTTRQAQDLDAARGFVQNIPQYLSIYRIGKETQDLDAARKFAGGIGEPFEKVRGFLEIYRVTKNPQDLAAAKNSIASVKDKDKRAVAAEMVKRAAQQAQAPNKEAKERYASS